MTAPSLRTKSRWQLLSLFQRPSFICLVLAMLTVGLFLPVVDFGFVNADDPAYFSANPNVLAGLTWPGVRWAFKTHEVESPYPLTWLSFMLDAELFGRGPVGPHLTNLLLHTANTVLLFLLLRKMTGTHWRSAFVAVLFGMHPLRVESVAWIAERKGLLSTAFGLLALLCYTLYAKTTRRAVLRDLPPHKTPDHRSNFRLDYHRVAWYLLAVLCLALGLMSKPMLVTLPFLLLLLDYWPLQRIEFAFASAPPDRPTTVPVWQLLLEKIPFFALAAAASWNQVAVVQQAGSLSSLSGLSLGARIGNALVSYTRYLGKTFWPMNLAFPYSHPGQCPLAEVLLAALLVAALSMFAILEARRQPWLFVGWYWFVGMMVPVIGLVQWGTQAMADRFSYVPLIGLFIIVAFAGSAALRQWPGLRGHALGLAALLLLLLACGFRSRDQLRYWSNGEALARHAIAVTKDNADAFNSLGGCLFRAGRYGEAVASYRKALLIDPSSANTHNNFGLALANLGKLDEAISNYHFALQESPGYLEALVNLGNAFAAQGRLDEALGQYLKALQREPNLVSALYNAGSVMQRKQDFNAAIRFYSRAESLSPLNPALQANLGRAQMANGNLQEARHRFETAVRLEPGNPQAHCNLGLVLMRLGKHNQAREQFTVALQLNPEYAEARQKLQQLDDSNRP